MNDRTDRPTNGEPGTGEGWTLFRFLDVADQLYDCVGNALAEVGLSYSKYEVLSHLREAGEPVSLGALAAGQQCARSNITQIIDRLEADGLVHRVPDPNDRRSILAELTPEGAELAEKGTARLDRLRLTFTDSLGRENCTQMNELLRKFKFM